MLSEKAIVIESARRFSVWTAMSDLVADLLLEAAEIEGHSVAESSKRAYVSNMKVYERTMETELKVPAKPVDCEKMMAFLVYMMRHGRTYNTLRNYVRGFSYYFRSNDLHNLANDTRFKVFVGGLRRKMTATGVNEKAKEPFLVDWFPLIRQVRPMNNFGNRLTMFWMTLAFEGFLRISELLALRRRDITVNEAQQRLELFIRRSKTDQFGTGHTTFICKSGGPADAWEYRDVLNMMGRDEVIVGMSEWQLRKILRRVLTEIGVKDVSCYSFHSFRRGGAHFASIPGANDAVIKAHGRWKSEAYQRYVVVDPQRTGREVTQALARALAPQ